MRRGDILCDVAVPRQRAGSSWRCRVLVTLGRVFIIRWIGTYEVQSNGHQRKIRNSPLRPLYETYSLGESSAQACQQPPLFVARPVRIINEPKHQEQSLDRCTGCFKENGVQ